MELNVIDVIFVLSQSLFFSVLGLTASKHF